RLLEKVNEGKDLTVDEIKRYQELVKPQKHVYGKYGTLKRKYLENKGLDWTIADLPTYLHGVDKRTGEFMEDYRRLTALQHAIEEEILSELIYTEEVV
ncbi:MAG: hypothetical protein K2O41_04935, partial [Clostridia bacterium]|nr:hypothetical protein [Clostridia bacterium]